MKHQTPPPKWDALLGIGFEAVSEWVLAGNGINPDWKIKDPQTNAKLNLNDVLYAFASDGHVYYVGKTTRGVKKRFVGYSKPGKRQQTNKKCHDEILVFLKRKKRVNILVFAVQHCLQYGDFKLNLAAGLEDDIIKTLRPPWNGTAKGVFVSETQENETIAYPAADATLTPTSSAVASNSPPKKSPNSFAIKLNKTYYKTGYINPGKLVDRLLGKHNEDICVKLGEKSGSPVLRKINREANSNQTVRIFGGKDVKAWFQRNFKAGAIVQGSVTSPNEIVLYQP